MVVLKLNFIVHDMFVHIYIKGFEYGYSTVTSPRPSVHVPHLLQYKKCMR